MVIATDIVAVGEGRRVGHGARDEACDGEIAELASLAGDDASDEAGDNGDEESVEYPPVTSIDDGVYKSVACSYTHYGKEESDTNLTYHLIGR